MLIHTTDEFSNRRISVEKTLSAAIAIIPAVVGIAALFGLIDPSKSGELIQHLNTLWPVLTSIGVLWYRRRYKEDIP